MSIASILIPVVVAGIFAYGLMTRTDVFSAFKRGATEGAKTAWELLPTLCALTLGINMLKASGALEGFTRLISPIAEWVGLPSECIPLILFRPISGSGSLTILEKLFGQYHPDSYIGRVASIYASATETVVYTFSVYFGAVSVKKTRYAPVIAVGGVIIAAVMAGVVASML